MDAVHRNVTGILFPVFLFAAGLCAQSKLPEIGPEVRSLFPAGGQKGTSIEVVFRGRRLEDVSLIEFIHPGIWAEVCHSDYYELVAVVHIGKDVPSGIHDYRMMSNDGATVGALHVSDLPALKEREPNNQPAVSQKVTLSVVVDGFIDNNDTDQFRFQAEAGDTLVFETTASRLGAGLDSQLTIIDSRGNEIAFNDDDGLRQDSKLVFQPKEKGEYIVQVNHAFPFGGPFTYYRLTMGKLPAVNHAFPLGLERGKTTEITISGVNLDQLRQVTLGTAKLPGSLVDKQAQQAKIRFQVPSDFPSGITSLNFSSGLGDWKAAVSLLISGTPEGIASGAGSRTAPQLLTIPAGVSGVIRHNRGTDFYAFEAKAGEQLAIQLQGSSLGSEMDPAILLYDPSGRLMVFQDEPVPWYFTEPPGNDPFLVQRFEKAGRYLLAVRDSAHNGGPAYGYHLSIANPQPDFQLRVNRPAATFFRGRKNTLTVRVKRVGGWDTPVEVWAEAAGAPLESARAIAEPKNSTVTDCNAKLWQLDGTDVELNVELPAATQPGQFPIHIRGRGTDGRGKVVEHTLTTMFYPGFSGPGMGAIQYQDLSATVTDLPPFIFDAPPNFNLIAGRSDKLRINVTRYEEKQQALPVSIEGLPQGVTVEGSELPAESSVIELKLTAAKETKPGTHQIRIKTGEIRTPVIEFKINPAPEKKK